MTPSTRAKGFRIRPRTPGRRPLRRWAGLALAALGAAAGGLALASCGIPTEATAHAIAATSKVNAAAPVTTTTATATRAGTVPIPVFFIGTGGELISEPRYVKPPASVTTAVDVLLAGPSTHELYSLGVTTAFPRGSGIRLVHANVVGHVVTLNFNSTFGNLSGSQEVLGVAQVVFTVTHAVTTNYGVLFEINGNPIPVPVASGGLVSSPVHESNYETLLAPGSTSTTTTPS